MSRLSLSLDHLKSRYDVVVVGSGYGGGIAASRLARAGRSVCLLERGDEKQPGEYPSTMAQAATELQMDSPAGRVGSATAMFDFHANKELNVLVGCGLGGTSLINANVSLPPEARVFDDPRWPKAFRADLETRFADGVRHARAMLKPQPYPDDWPPLAKTTAHEQSAKGMGQPFHRVAINVTFEDGVNHVGVEQHKCTLCGDCVTGCNYGAKNTTLMNYLPDAVNHGAQIFTRARVRHVTRGNGEWIVHFEAVGDGREQFNAPALTVAANLVVLAAGTLGSTEILLRSKARGLPLSSRVGERFSGNGDVLGFAYNAKPRINGIGWGDRAPGTLDPVGPCITSVIDIREQPNLEDGLIIEEGSLPGAMAPYLAPAFAAAGAGAVAQGGLPIANLPRHVLHEVHSVVGGSHVGSVDHTQTFLIMSHDGSDGRMYLEDDRLRIDWPGIGSRPAFTRGDDQLRAASTAIDAVYVKNPLWTKALGDSVISVHPLGGCAMAERAEEGVTNHKGQVFAGASGADVHEGLYVADGAVLPRSVGVNPLLTISGIAERACSLIAQDRGWTIDYTLPSAPAHRRERRMGLQFTERMVGYFSTQITDTFESAERQGKSDRSKLEFILTVHSDDVEAMLADASHPARMHGTVIAPALSPQPLTAVDGRFNLFVDNPNQIAERNMRYQMQLRDEGGRTWYFEGFKRVVSGALTEVWPATSTLFVAVHDGPDAKAPVIGRGILHIRPVDFARQLTTMQVPDASSPAAAVTALTRFGTLFAGVLWQNYGGALGSRVVDPGSVPAAVRPHRSLDAPEPETFVFAAGDGAELRLVRVQGGTNGPLVCAPGFSNSTGVFMVDAVDDTFVEFFARHGYDLWLLDYRASPDLPVSHTPFTIDDIARYDWPAAIDFVRRATGAADVQVLAHCMGSMTAFMALLNGMPGVRQLVASAMTPHPSVEIRGKVKSQFHLTEALELLGASGLSTRVDASVVEDIVDRLIALYPIPKEWAGLGRTCRRIYAIYGPVFLPSNLNRGTADALNELFGFANLRAFEQIAMMMKLGRLVDAKGGDTYLPNVKRLQLPITLIHGAENAFLFPEGSERTFEWLRANNDPALYRRHVIPGYSHLDCFIGRDAARDVFPLILAELDPLAG